MSMVPRPAPYLTLCQIITLLAKVIVIAVPRPRSDRTVRLWPSSLEILFARKSPIPLDPAQVAILACKEGIEDAREVVFGYADTPVLYGQRDGVHAGAGACVSFSLDLVLYSNEQSLVVIRRGNPGILDGIG